MKNIIIIFAGLLIIGGVFLYLNQSGLSIQLVETEPKVPPINRSGQVLLTTGIEENTGNPQILEAKLIAENSEQLVFNVTYFYPDSTTEGSYNISIHPNNSDWSYSTNTLEQGTHTIPITVSLKIKDTDQKTSSSDILYFYISHAKDRKYIGKVFNQAVAFEKIWQKRNH